tara:strand:+ start:1141 stop:2388 length:1248 start_codon:yes stop_codon:yes gene_type:complete
MEKYFISSQKRYPDMPKILMLVCDGMADRPLKELHGKTPLEVAIKKNLDFIAKMGINGLLDPIAPGIRVGSDTTHLALLGYDPYSVYTGRGPLEAIGCGIKLKKGDIAFRSNFATVDEQQIVLDRRAGRIDEGTKDLANEINKIKVSGAQIIFKESTAHRGALVLRGIGLSCNISDSDPHIIGSKVLDVNSLDSSLEAKKSAEIVNEFSKNAMRVLKDHEINVVRLKNGLNPANMLLLRGCGSPPDILSFKDKYTLEGGCIATTGILKGLARSLDMELIPARKDYKKRIIDALKYLENNDFLLINFKETDDASHDNLHLEKIKIIEKIDRVLGPLKEFIKENYLIILSDHTTSTKYGDHTADPVPIVIAGPEVRRDNVDKFDEIHVARGGLNRIKGKNLIPIMLDLINKSEKFGA